ncbi:cell envelope integrity protein CreD [Marivirga sp. S37H4]|uniref:Cell envelope integrity protein CreD n=1 Tax=Marivirga aurantiaca TaxID=2802615 RepID=A0A934X0X1_9BACT|nr:cell envelope integrity protein CreD [Marivirga aurantiaca]MBK6266462.1 cell envelope integrity protein CreD [Marivirga aurantiaca]
MEESKSVLEKLQEWTNKSVSLKLLTIGFIILMLLIPQSFISDLIRERQVRQFEVEQEVTEKWSRQQTLIGPYLSLPFYTIKEIMVEKELKYVKEHKTAYFFPQALSIDGNVDGKSLHRGIFDVVVYNSDLNLKGNFTKANLTALGIDAANVNWDKLKMHVSLSDMRGIGENTKIIVNGKEKVAEPYHDDINNLSGLVVDLEGNEEMDAIQFSCKLALKGSKGMFFTPIGKTTTVNLKGDWNSPSFQGDFIPENRNVTESGFEGEWKVLHFNRPFGQEFVNNMPNLEKSSFGLTLNMPVDQYQKSTRTAKYALLIIVLSFLSMFLMEIIGKNKIHPLQYTLVGLALILYYTLLIALSEHIGFSKAYFISSASTILLLVLYSFTLFTKKINTIIFSIILCVFYLFIYIITKEQDYALLIGSFGLFIALAVTMFASRKINWYKANS